MKKSPAAIIGALAVIAGSAFVARAAETPISKPLPEPASPPAAASAPPTSTHDLTNAPAPVPAAPVASTNAAPLTPVGPAAPVEPAPNTTWTPPSPTPTEPNWTWTTKDGKIYQKVRVLKMTPQSVTIMHEDGGASIPLASLPPDLQRRFNYDAKAASQWAVGEMVSGNLVALKNGAVDTADDALLRPVHYIALYYAAMSSAPCVAFTPKLVKFYGDFKLIHPNFEVLFISEDRTAAEMALHMRQSSMPWPAVSFGALVHPPGQFKGSGIEAFAGAGIPDLVLLDSTGRVLSDSYRNGKYVGPDAVLTDLPTLVR